MKNILTLFFFLCLNASANFMQNLTQTHIRGLNTILFFASEDIISSGHFRFKKFDTNLDNYFFPFSFPVDSSKYNYDYYINGTLGFSNFSQKNINLYRGTYDRYNLHNYAFKIGAGIQYYVSRDTDFKIGLSYIYSYVVGKYKTEKPLMVSNPEDRAINTLLNISKQYHTFEVSSSLTYHPDLYNYKPYSSVSMRHFSTHLNSRFTSRSIIKSTIVKLKVGLITPPISELFGLSLTLEPYASTLYVYGDIEDSLDLNTIYILGNTFRLNAYPVTRWVEDFISLQRDSLDWVRELTFDMNIIKGHNFKGFNLSFGVKF
jgi:hypothetical protein